MSINVSPAHDAAEDLAFWLFNLKAADDSVSFDLEMKAAGKSTQPELTELAVQRRAKAIAAVREAAATMRAHLDRLDVALAKVQE